MGRLINPDGAGKDRKKLSQAVVLALRELMKQSEPDNYSRDLASFLSIALLKIFNTVDTSVTAWEKKGYWVKADRFRMEWEWTSIVGNKMRQAVLSNDWDTIAKLSAQVGQKFFKVSVPIRHQLGTPWVGAWEIISKKS